MNCKNGDKYLFEAINSVLKLNETDWELIFFDNKSSDNSLLIAKKFANQDKRIKVFESFENLTLGEARKRALNNAKGKYISFLDVDDLYLPSFFNGVQKIFEKNNIICTYANSEFFKDTQTIRIAHRKKMPSGNLRFRILFKYFIPLETVILNNELLKKYQISFDPKLNHCSDWALILEAALYGLFYYRTSEVVSKWRIHEKNESVVSDYKFFVEKLDFIKRNSQTKLRLNYLFGTFLTLFINFHFLIYYIKRKELFKVCEIEIVREKLIVGKFVSKVKKFV